MSAAVGSSQTPTVRTGWWSRRGWFSARRLLLACAVGTIVGVNAFALTSTQAPFEYIGFCHPGIAQGFDPWTGLPHGSTLYCQPEYAIGPAGSIVRRPVPASIQTAIPPELASRRAIPIPLGFVLGAGALLLVAALKDVLWRRTRQPSIP
jgi:hypothetical protein